MFGGNVSLDFEQVNFLSNFEDLKKFQFEGQEFFLPNDILEKKIEKFSSFLESKSKSVFSFIEGTQDVEVILSERREFTSKKGNRIALYNFIFRDLNKKDQFYPAEKIFVLRDTKSKEDEKIFGKIFKTGKWAQVLLEQPQEDSYAPLQEKHMKFRVGHVYKTLDKKEKENKADRIELFFKTGQSNCESMLSEGDIVKLAETFEPKVAGICDLGGFYSFLSIDKASYDSKNQKKIIYPVFGSTLYVIGKGDRKFRLLFYPRTTDGLRFLYKTFSEAWINGSFEGSPFFTWDQVNSCRDNGVMVFMPSYCGEMTYTALTANIESSLPYISMVDGIVVSPIDQHCYCWENPMTPFRDKGKANKDYLENFLTSAIKRAKALNKFIFLSNFPCAIEKEQENILEVVLFSERREDFITCPKRFLTREEMKKWFSFVVDRFGEDFWAECVDVNPIKFFMEIEDIQVTPKGLSLPKMPNCADENEELKRLTIEGLKRTYGKDWQKVLPQTIKKRIKYELESITSKYSVIYLASLKAIEYSKSLGYPVGSRGSVGSSAVAHFSGISEVNPLPPHYRCKECFSFFEFFEGKEYQCGWDLPGKTCPNCGKELLRDGFDIEFSTFMGADGKKVADIDLNFSGNMQKLVMAYVCDDLFAGSAYRVGTIMKVKEHRLLQVMNSLMGCNIGKNVFYAQLGSGMKKATGKHPGGVIVIPQDQPYYNFSPLNFTEEKEDRRGDGVYTTHYDFNYLHDYLLKMDLLASDSIEFLYLLSKTTGVDHENIDFFSPEVFSLFQRGDTLGVNEFTTLNAIDMIKDIKPTKWQHLCSMSGLQHGTGVWQGNAKDILASNRATIDEVDGCRDDIIKKLTIYLNSFEKAYEIIESVRKGKGIPQNLYQEAREKIPDWYFNFVDKIQYMFPKAHAAAYLIISAKQAWYKIHHLNDFYCAYLSMKLRKNKLIKDVWIYYSKEQLEQEIKLTLNAKRGNIVVNAAEKEKHITICLLLMEMLEKKISIKPPHPNYSSALEFSPKKDCVLSPLTLVPNLGHDLAEKIIEERNTGGAFENMLDLFKRTDISHAAMIKLHSYKNFGIWSEELKEKGVILRKGVKEERKKRARGIRPLEKRFPKK